MRFTLLPATDRGRWVLLLVFTLVVRGVVLWGMFGKLADDPDGYRQLAENLAREGIYGYGQVGSRILPTAYRPPLYPLVLSNAMDPKLQLSLGKVAILHLALGVGTVLLTFDLGQRLKLGDWSYLAALLVCCDPILLNQSALVMTETLATFMSVLSLWCLVCLTQSPEWWNALMAGGAMGLSTLCRPTFLPWVALSLLAILFLSKVSWSRCLGHCLALVGGTAALLLPWGIRNYCEIDRFVVTTTHGGYTLYLGNNARFYEHVASGKEFDSFEDYTDDMWFIEVEETIFRKQYIHYRDQTDQRYYECAWQQIQEQPRMFVYTCALRQYQLFNPLPHPTSKTESVARRLVRYAVALWYIILYLLAAIGCIRLWREFRTPPWLWGVLLVVTFLAVHTFYWTNIRMRAPLMPFLSLVAAAGALHLAEPLAHASLLRRKRLRSC